MAVPERLLHIEVTVVSIRTGVLGRFIACGWYLEVVVNGGSTVYPDCMKTHLHKISKSPSLADNTPSHYNY